VAANISVVIAVDYVSAPLGVLNVSRFLCNNQEDGGIIVEFDGHRTSYEHNHDCSPTNGDITIELQSEVSLTSVTTVRLGPDGNEDIELASGSYVLTDESTGKTASFDILAGRRIYAAIVDRVIGGDGIGTDDPDDPGGSDGTGSGDEPTPVPGGDNTGGEDNSGSGDGSGVDNGSTDGGVEAGGSGDAVTGDAVADVTALPNTGSHSSGNSTELWLALLAVASIAGAAGAVTLAQRRSER